MSKQPFSGPHQGQPLLQYGASLAEAQAGMVLIHGRGSSAVNILSLAAEFAHPTVAYLAPQAAGGTWYPNRFIAPIASNEPGITSGMVAIADALGALEAAGVPAERVVLLGFSQGACLAVEFAARHARRYGGIAVLSGGLIGPDGTPRDYPGSLAGTPVFFGCSEADFHIPLPRVRESSAVIERLGAAVTTRIYPGMEHTVNLDEIATVRAMLDTITSSPPPVRSE